MGEALARRAAEMVRVGLVAYVEEQLERDISLGRLPRNGRLASERMMARWYGVSRGTVREALRRLAARGLVVQRSGRQARAVALDESLTLENLGLALHDERSEACRRLLEGFFSLRRQVLVELLADCCANASVMEMGPLEDICFQLWDEARWNPGERCAQLEFELLRQAAQTVARPGHLLLIQSLQRAFRGISARLLPFMGGESLRQWAICAQNALQERDVQALQHQLPALLKACDERVLDQFAPRPQEHVSPEAPHAQECLLGAPSSATVSGNASEAGPCIETGDPGDSASVSGQDDAPEALPCVESRGLCDLVAATAQDDAREALSCVEERGLGRVAPAAEETSELGIAPGPHGQALPRESDIEVPRCPATPGAVSCEPGGASAGGDVTGATLGTVSDCRTRWDAPSPDGGLQFEVPPTGSRGHTRGAVCKEGGPLHGAQRPLGRWAARLWRFIAHSLGLPAS
ncbi:FadR/GntR family transcriptional regulator [Corallococcus exercitus]|uniref:FadR/GntR family transcriptional regulator n=1 Tax=Corallococcus exercitus TaxID=2316736 RepID=UPI001FC9DA4A|nr:GntR family transcriptional regulator [Corallococcus exercitus]